MTPATLIHLAYGCAVFAALIFLVLYWEKEKSLAHPRPTRATSSLGCLVIAPSGAPRCNSDPLLCHLMTAARLSLPLFVTVFSSHGWVPAGL